MENQNATPKPETPAELSCTELLAQLVEARATNQRLNRRCQELQSAITGHDHYSWGFRSGYEAAQKSAEKLYEQKLADYKHATRKEMERLRCANDKLNHGGE
jgi:predicted metallo-beta-lactamase superfamily hydrolase